MDLTPELEHRFATARSEQDNYQPSDGVRRVIKDKTLVMIVAPAAMGKSYVISRAIEANPRFAQTVSFTTRDPRAGDDGNMRTIPRDNEHIGILLDLIESGQVVNYTIFPTTGMMYGTDLSSYPGEVNLMPTLANSAETLRRTGFGECITIGLVAPLDTWQMWFNTRFPELTQEKTARLKEALLSISWLLQDSSVRWLINRDGEIDTVAQELITIAENDVVTHQDTAISYARAIREYIVETLK